MACYTIMDFFLFFQLHLLHWNPKYSNYLDAVRRTDGIAVLAIFLQVSRSRQPFFVLLLLSFLFLQSLKSKTL